MTPAWLIFWPLLAVTVAALLIYRRSDDSGAWLAITGLAALAAFMFLIVGLIITLSRHYGRVSCHTFAAQTHRPTRFVIYTSWDGGDCLTRSGDGTWIPTKNLREFGAKP